MSQINTTDQSQPTQEALLRAMEVSRILNISRSMTYQLLQSGRIPVVRIGNSVRVRPKDLNEFINQNLDQKGRINK